MSENTLSSSASAVNNEDGRSSDLGQGQSNDLVESVANKLLPVLSNILDEKIAKLLTHKPEIEVVGISNSGTRAQGSADFIAQFGNSKDRGNVPSLKKALKRPADHLGQVFEGSVNSESEMVELSGEEDGEIKPESRHVMTSWTVPDITAGVTVSSIKAPLTKADRAEIFSQFPFPKLNGIRMPVLEETFVQIFKQRKLNIK